MAKRKQEDPFKARLSYTSEDDPLFRRLLMGTVEYATGRQRLEKIYAAVKSRKPGPQGVWQMILEELEITMIFDDTRLQRLPQEGPLIVISNHPFGVVDGLILGHLLARVRPAFFVLVNEVLCREELLNPYFLPIDFRETREAMQMNIQSRKLAMERLQDGEAMGIFPSGGVATSPKPWQKPEDLEWKRFVVKMIRQTRATVLPLYIHGRNSRLFQLASQISLNLRLSLLLNEVRNKIGKEILITIGEPIPYAELAHFKDRQKVLDHLRAVTEGLAVRMPESGKCRMNYSFD